MLLKPRDNAAVRSLEHIGVCQEQGARRAPVHSRLENEVAINTYDEVHRVRQYSEESEGTAIRSVIDWICDP